MATGVVLQWHVRLLPRAPPSPGWRRTILASVVVACPLSLGFAPPGAIRLAPPLPGTPVVPLLCTENHRGACVAALCQTRGEPMSCTMNSRGGWARDQGQLSLKPLDQQAGAASQFFSNGSQAFSVGLARSYFLHVHHQRSSPLHFACLACAPQAHLRAVGDVDALLLGQRRHDADYNIAHDAGRIDERLHG